MGNSIKCLYQGYNDYISALGVLNKVLHLQPFDYHSSLALY